MRKILKKAGSLVLVGALSLGVLSGCADSSDSKNTSTNSSSSQESKKTEKHVINVAKTTSSALTNPLIQLATEKGYFDDYNVKIKETTVDTNAMYESVAVGKIDASYATVIGPLSFAAKGSDITFFGGTLSGGMLLITKEENYDELLDFENWKGKKIGVVQLSTSEMVSKYVLGNEYGYKKGAELNYSFFDDYPSIVIGVQKGNVDVGFISSEYLESALDIGLVKLYNLADVQKDYVCCRQYGHTQAVYADRDGYVGYLKAQIKAYKDYKLDEDGTIASLADATGESKDYIYQFIYNKETNAAKSYNPDPNYNGVKAIYDTLVEWDYIESDADLLDVSEFTDLTIYADALKEVIAENPDDDFYKDMWEYFKENNNKYPNFDETFSDSYLEN